MLRKDVEARCVTGEYLHVGPERPLYEAEKMKCGLHWRPHGVGDARALCYLPKRTANCGSSPRERSVLQTSKLEGVGNLKRPLTSNMEMQNLEFALLCFCLALVQYFFTMLLPSFWNGSAHSVPCMLKYVTCLLIFLWGLQ